MADITMCPGGKCPRRAECYRYTAPFNEFRQSMWLTAPVKVDGTCEQFWSNVGLYASSESLKKKGATV